MRTTVSRLLALAPDARRGIAGLAALSLVVTATYLAQGVLIARVLAAVFDRESLASRWPDFVAIVVLQAARAVVFVWRDATALAVSGRVKEAVREALTVKLLALGPGSLQRMRSGSLQSTTVDAVELLDPLIGRFLPQIAASVLGAVASTPSSA
jgi:ATP-binding cassette, subfamily C, bacterial CydD